MLLTRSVFGPTLVWLAASPVWAAKRPLSKVELQTQADRIVIATVKSHRTQTRRPAADGDEVTDVSLNVVVESVEKNGQPEVHVGQVLDVTCWRLTRTRHRDGDFGQHQIPDKGSRARFYLNGPSAMHPNGIEVLDGPRLRLSLVVEKEPEKEEPESNWRLVIVVVTAVVLAAVAIAWLYRRAKRKRGKPYLPPTA